MLAASAAGAGGRDQAGPCPRADLRAAGQLLKG